MPDPEDFNRVGDLLGGVCEAAATPGVPVPKSDPDSSSPRGVPSRGPSAQGASSGAARAVALVWPELVGAEVAANTSPTQLKNGRLTVSTSSSVWADALGYMGADLTSRLNERLGSEVVTQMVFRHGGWEERPSRGAPGVPRQDQRGEQWAAVGAGANNRLSAEQEEALAGVEELDLPPEIREIVTRAMRASFARTQGDSVR